MKKNSALILIDIQNDFCEGGSMGVKDTDSLIETLNHLQTKFDLVIATKDWHPSGHVSFAANHPGNAVGDTVQLDDYSQALWPVHCVAETHGAEFPSALNTQQIKKVFFKGIDKHIDSYSAFFDNNHVKQTGLIAYLKENKISDVYFSGLVTEFCVKHSVLDAITSGFKAYLVKDACRAVNMTPRAAEFAIAEMVAAGALVIESKEIKPTQ